MDESKLLDCLKHIKLGIGEVFYFDYDGDPLPLRPISSFELDDSTFKTVGSLTTKVSNLVVKLRLEMVDPKKYKWDYEVSDYAELQNYYLSLSYWIAYHGMKDFQDIEFKKPITIEGVTAPRGFFIVRKMNGVHEIADEILDRSAKPKEVIKEILKDDTGKEVAYIVYYLKQPLGEIGKLTKFQRDYLLYAKGELLGNVKPKDPLDKYSFSNEKTTLGDFLGGVKNG